MMRRGFSYGGTSGGGGGGTPGGADTQVQINDAGVFYGDAGFTYNKTTKSIDLGGATITADAPVLDLSQTWNNAAVTFTGVKVNVTDTASAAGSKYLDLQVNGATQLSLTPNDFNITKRIINPTGGAWLTLQGGTGAGVIFAFNGTQAAYVSNGTLALHPNNANQALLTTDASHTFAQRNGTNAQTFRVYDTHTDASNYARIALNAGAAGDWVQIAAETAGTGADNYGIALTPAGTGAISAHVPDSTAAGGDARGSNAVDWQQVRGDGTRVASGTQATVGGGNSNTAAGTWATVSGGYFNLANGQISAISGGQSNIVSAQAAAIGGGYTNTASGEYSWIPGGAYGSTHGINGAGAYASGQRAAQGDAQVILQPVRQTTSSTATVNLTADAAAVSTANCMVLPVNSGCQFEGRLTAVHAAGAAVGGWKVEGMARRGASGAATVVGLSVTAFTADAAIGTPTVTVVGGAGGELLFEVTPANATTTYWVGRLELIQAA